MRWLRFAIGAVLRLWLAMVVVFVIGWLLVEAAPGSTQERAARAAGAMPPEDAPAGVRQGAVAAVAAELGLDRPLGARILAAATAAARLDLGRSWRDGASVRARIGAAAGATLGLGLGALLAALVGGAWIAAASAAAPRSRRDRVLAWVTALAIATPPVWLAVLLLRLDDGAALAVLALAVAPMAIIGRVGRIALLEVCDAPLATAVRARGGHPSTVMRHAAALALPRLAPLLPATVGYLAGAALVMERAFGIHGLGTLLLDAAARGDAPVVAGVSAAVAAAVSVAASAAELVARTADPRLGEARA